MALSYRFSLRQTMLHCLQFIVVLKVISVITKAKDCSLLFSSEKLRFWTTDKMAENHYFLAENVTHCQIALGLHKSLAV